VRRWDTITRTRHFVQGKRGYLSLYLSSRLRPISGTHTRKYKNIKIKRKWKGGHNIKKKKKHDKRLYFTIPTTTLSSGVIISSSFYCYFGCPGERDPNVLSKSSSPHFHVLSVYVVFLSPFDIPRLLRIWHPRNQQERNNSSSSWTEKK
jgi:hypothetical protein